MRRHTSTDERIHHRWFGGALAMAWLLLALPAAAGPPDAEVLPPGVTVRLGPAANAPVAGKLVGGTKVEVLVTQRGPDGDWAQVALPSGGMGFVPEQALRRLVRLPQWTSTGGPTASTGLARRTPEGGIEVPLRRMGGGLLVTALVNSQAPTNFIVDTGAAIVSISKELADSLRITYADAPRQMLVTPSGIMSSPRIVLDSIHVPDESGAGVSRVPAVVSTLPGAPRGIAGLLGQTFLRHFRVTIEAERGMLRLESIR